MACLEIDFVPGDGKIFTYDYRTRRVELVTSTVSTKYIFSGGTSVRELNNGVGTVDYVRGSDWGGGVGGILYSVRAGVPSFTHYNRRGDVTVKTDATGDVTYQATYEAFGKRATETGATADQQKSNTKDEDIPGYTNEGFRFRDLEIGSFISRDPLGFIDGPNMYAYVVQNPWTKFDPRGLMGKRKDDDGFKWKGTGHHTVPREVGKDWHKDAKAVFDKAVIGADAHDNTRHPAYSKEVSAEMADFLKANAGGKSVGEISAKEQKKLAAQFVDHIGQTDNSFIKGFNEAVPGGPGSVDKWFGKTGQHLTLKATGKAAGEGGKIVSGMANFLGKGGKMLAKGVPIVAGALTVGAGIAEGKSANEIGADVMMSATGADMLQFAAESIAAPVVPVIQSNIERRNEIPFWNGGMETD